MVTLKACIIMKDMRKDGTWRVVIRLTYKRKSRMIPTSMYVSRGYHGIGQYQEPAGH